MTWHDARQFCMIRGSHLVDVDSMDENNFVANMVHSAGIKTNFWIGLNDLVSEMNFRASDGSQPKFFNWNGVEPNEQGDEDCAEVYANTKWNDKNCMQKRSFVCEKSEGTRDNNFIFQIILFYPQFLKLF